jgi:hypothetical protein
VDDLFARQVVRQGTHRRRSCWRVGRGGIDIGNGALGFQLFQCQLELRDLAAELLRRRAELHPAQPRDLSAQRVGEQVAGGERGIGPGERGL